MSNQDYLQSFLKLCYLVCLSCWGYALAIFSIDLSDVNIISKVIQMGLPRGSILGPILFLIDMNNVLSRINTHSTQGFMFAVKKYLLNQYQINCTEMNFDVY